MKYLYAISDYGYSPELYHYGTKGQKWGERRWQYKDGSLTPEGRIHYGVGEPRAELYRHYGYGKGAGGIKGSEHTKGVQAYGRRKGAKEGAIKGAGIGLGLGTIAALGSKQMGLGFGKTALAVGAIGGGAFALSTLSGAIKGAKLGKLEGIESTKQAREEIEKYQYKELKDFLKQDKAEYKQAKQDRKAAKREEREAKLAAKRAEQQAKQKELEKAREAERQRIRKENGWDDDEPVDLRYPGAGQRWGVRRTR